MNSTEGPEGRYKDDNAYRQKFTIPLYGDAEAVLKADDWNTCNLREDYRTSETVWCAMSHALRDISQRPVDDSVRRRKKTDAGNKQDIDLRLSSAFSSHSL